MKTKNQKRLEILAKFETELADLKNKHDMIVKDNFSKGYTYVILPSTRQLYVESQINSLKRNLQNG